MNYNKCSQKSLLCRVINHSFKFNLTQCLDMERINLMDIHCNKMELIDNSFAHNQLDIAKQKNFLTLLSQSRSMLTL